MYFEYDDITLRFVLLQHGLTPLHRATQSGSVASIEFLLNKGAKLDHSDNVSILSNI